MTKFCSALLTALFLLGLCGGTEREKLTENGLRLDTRQEIDRLARTDIRELNARFRKPGTADCGRYTYELLPGTAEAVEVAVSEGAEEGPAVYVVGGLHGDETAGWLAAGRLREGKIRAGKVYVLALANAYGAERRQRVTKEGWDLNRSFPGDEEGVDAYRIAAAIYEDILDKKPVLVLDLHEAKPREGERDSLGNTVICQNIEETGGLIWEILMSTEAGELCSAPFSLYGGPPEGSLNYAVSRGPGIPVITAETDRGAALETRVFNHLDLAGFILEYYGLF